MSHLLTRVPFSSSARMLGITARLLACGCVVSLGLFTGCSDTPPDDDSPTASPTPTSPTPTATACPDSDSDGSCEAADCAPTDANIHPGATDIAYDGIDQDCDGVDRTDVDGDGYPGGATGNDCNDNDSNVNPGKAEDCSDNLDNNCDNEVDNLPSCPDNDYDKDGVTETQGDCDDQDPNQYPGNIESYDGKDNNCDGQEGRIMGLKPNVDVTISGDVSSQLVGTSLAGVRVANFSSANGDAYADLVVGAPGYGGQGRGAVALYFGGPTWAYSAPFSAAPLLFSESQPDARAGSAVGGLGDLNYDGLQDFGVGTPFYNSNVTDCGRGHVFLGQTANWLSGDLELRDSSSIPGYFKETYMGTSLDGGDVTGDGKEDMLIGAKTATDGWVFILPGEGTVPVSIQLDDIAKIEAKDGRLLGGAVAFAGDVNSDLIGDIIAGGAYESSNQGYMLFVPGSSNFKANTWYDIENSGPGTTALAQYIEFYGDISGEGAGWSVSGNGDVNQDGAPDFIGGDFSTRDTNDPAAFLFFGGSKFLNGNVPAQGSKSLNSSANVKIKLGQFDACPCAVNLEGDLNGDGYDDILVGAANAKKDGNSQPTGAVYIFLGRPNWPSTLTMDLNADYILYGASTSEMAGYAISFVGDLNADGRDDFAVGAPNADVLVNGTTALDAGRAYVLFGIDAPTP